MSIYVGIDVMPNEESPILLTMYTMRNDSTHHWAIAHQTSLRNC